GCIVTTVRTKRKQKKQCSSKVVNEGERCKRTRNDTDESPSTKGKTSPHPTYRNAEKGCLVNNSMKRHKKQPSSKAVNKKGGCRRPCKDTDQFPSTKGKTTSQPRYKETDKVVCFLYHSLYDNLNWMFTLLYFWVYTLV
ncbi:hypothetical protein HN873_067756, partial [Arachis hypogaea]